ncbi:hypothetical protein M409DRAFT_65083 [Zasmidium cellare ATCC 36951]|uniref:J domain-containing protein n=1 Tax=Zasmidium cellare ATCC 36951 TaxID=1080233 RepID=A0A6A6CQ45_ZASCE|nr:uncharacterized protein M409DRAFT_65083 [Zasmidium cellare ATCC 36951]KAF2169407.1 hypothetical protein M409DRAFT_65083 [Zasmidium cellare ATCC 36951]
MVKPDLKHNYYSDLELPTTASVDDIRKAYRKLALQYHPDRNAGKEDECVPRFQAIQAANEVLSDPTTKAKYDQDRRKAGLYPTFKPNQPTPGNPYAATSNYPPPPRRTQPGTWQRPTPAAAPAGTAPSGADRFTNFPRPGNTMPRKDPAADRAQQFQAWQNMNSGTAKPRYPYNAPPPPQPPKSPNPQTQNTARPRMPRQDTKMPTEEQIRAGMRYSKPAGPGGSGDSPAAEKQSAWQAFQQANASKPGMGRNSRRAANTTPRRPGGFDPNAPGSDERPAPQSTGHYSHRNRSEDLSPGGFPPPPPGPPPGSAPQSPTADKFQRPFAPQAREVPYAEGNRKSTPYSSFIGEKLQFSSDGLRRSASTRDTTRLQPESNSTSTNRARSSSPAGRQPQPTDGPTSGTKKPFIPGAYSDSSTGTEGSSEFEPDVTETPEEMDSSASNSERPKNAGFSVSRDRPKKTPTRPSSKLNGSNYSSNATSPAFEAAGAQSDGDHPTMQQRKSSQNMYAPPSSFAYQSPSFSRGKWVANAFGSASTTRPEQRNAAIPKWAFPSSVCPSKKPKKWFSASQDATQRYYDMAKQDILWDNVSNTVQTAYLLFCHELASRGVKLDQAVGVNLTNFLALVHPRIRKTGVPQCDEAVAAVVASYPAVCHFTLPDQQADQASSANSFNFVNSDAFTSAASKSRSFDNINTKFSPDGWNGSFTSTAAPDYFAAGRRPSPGRRAPSNRGHGRAATADVPPRSNSNTPGDMGPPPPPEQPASMYTSPSDVKFNEEQWKDTFKDPSWTMPPVGSHRGTSSKTPSRKGSRLHTKTSADGVGGDGSKAQPHIVVDDDDNVEAQGSKGRPDSGGFVEEGDAMDIDTTPPTQQAEQGAASTKEPRLYAVPKSTWREKAEQNQQTAGARKASSRHNRQNTEPTLKTNLDDLSHVEPIAQSAAGLQNLADLSSTLPFQSSTTPSRTTQSAEPQKLQTPPIPRVPVPPNRLTKASWHTYALSFATYLEAYHAFNKTMLAHFDAREKQASARLLGGSGWLEAIGGDTSTSLGFTSYWKGVQEDEKVRETWNIGCEKHMEAVRQFDELRERVRKLSLQGALTDS